MSALPKTHLPDHDYIRIYESGIKALQSDPTDRNIQHTVVLALARSGALDLAISEYTRYGLSTVTSHEDIMALNGRLSKDLYLRTTGETATAHAIESAKLYAAAFDSTKGYYSGINAATMALMADMPIDVVHARAKTILSLLPKPTALTPTDHYFIEATRAECYLLLGAKADCQTSLKNAVSFDPLNYAAHATTLKQFTMICKKRGETTDWLSPFYPPRATHYAGHIRLVGLDTRKTQDTLKTRVMDTIQKHDIGFAFGALAAGSDIIIAEAMLSEGVELNIILPCDVERFCAHSVTPFGTQWLPRFHACLKRAHSMRVVGQDVPWPDAQLNQLTAQIAMGQAVLRGRALSRHPVQLLIWDGDIDGSYTAVHAKDWADDRRKTLSINAPRQSRAASQKSQMKSAPLFVLKSSVSNEIQSYPDAQSAVTAARQLRDADPQCAVALHVTLPGQELSATCNTILKNGAPQSLLASEDFASLFALSDDENHDIHFAGLVRQENAEPMRCYAVGL